VFSLDSGDGPVRFRAHRPANPCRCMDVVLAPGAFRGMCGRGGVRCEDRLHDFCYALLRHREDAADAVADTFVIVAERIGQLRDPDRLRPWLYAIAAARGCAGSGRASGSHRTPRPS
jgi:DNA-directed RNA polymerase specialized sigma subunit, sigma24 homolog